MPSEYDFIYKTSFSIVSLNMKHWENFLNFNLKEHLEKAIHIEELVYPINLLDVSLRNFQLKKLGIGLKLHYWEMVQIHEMLNDLQVLPESYDDTIWYQYLSAYLILPKMEQLIELNHSSWNAKIAEKNEILIEEAVRMSLNMLKLPKLKNKILEQMSGGSHDSSLKRDVYEILSRKELTYSVKLLEVSLRNLEIEIQYWTVREMHENMKYSGVLPIEYSQNFWYRCITAYVIINHVDVKELIDLSKNGWSETARLESERLVLNFDLS